MSHNIFCIWCQKDDINKQNELYENRNSFRFYYQYGGDNYSSFLFKPPFGRIFFLQYEQFYVCGIIILYVGLVADYMDKSGTE